MNVELSFDFFQVVDVHQRSERLTATAASDLPATLTLILVELNTELRRALKDVKVLAKRQV